MYGSFSSKEKSYLTLLRVLANSQMICCSGPSVISGVYCHLAVTVCMCDPKTEWEILLHSLEPFSSFPCLLWQQLAHLDIEQNLTQSSQKMLKQIWLKGQGMGAYKLGIHIKVPFTRHPLLVSLCSPTKCCEQLCARKSSISPSHLIFVPIFPILRTLQQCPVPVGFSGHDTWFYWGCSYTTEHLTLMPSAFKPLYFSW